MPKYNFKTIKIWQETYRKLKLMSAILDQSMSQTVSEMVDSYENSGEYRSRLDGQIGSEIVL